MPIRWVRPAVWAAMLELLLLRCTLSAARQAQPYWAGA